MHGPTDDARATRGKRRLSSQPFGPGRMRAAHAPTPDPPPGDRPVSPVSLRRVGALFGPYRARLAVLLSLIFVSAGLGVISPFLLRELINKAYPQHDTKLVI